MASKQEPLIAYALTELGRDNTIWDRVGIAFVNRDGSINIQLRAIPLSGKIQLRKKEVSEDAPPPPKAA